MRNFATEIKGFYNYVFEFYNKKNGIYPIANSTQIQNAVNKYLSTKPITKFDFDSFDREEVRKILDPSYKIL
jgi:hypothetical protein